MLGLDRNKNAPHVGTSRFEGGGSLWAQIYTHYMTSTLLRRLGGDADHDDDVDDDDDGDDDDVEYEHDDDT